MFAAIALLALTMLPAARSLPPALVVVLLPAPFVYGAALLVSKVDPADKTISIDDGAAVFAAAGAPKEWWLIPDAGTRVASTRRRASTGRG
ncbi:MAG: hypothetical protein GEU75_09125 [Dehalococcoidia bacterium]|nr:hypothetical protein [Dehalococcoidia bacterium]